MESLSMDWSKQSHIDIESQLEVTQEARERGYEPHISGLGITTTSRIKKKH
jgi:hypothetical protein